MNENTISIDAADFQPLIDALQKLAEQITEVFKKIAEDFAKAWQAYMKTIYGEYVFREPQTHRQKIKAYLRKMLNIPHRILWFFTHRHNS